MKFATDDDRAEYDALCTEAWASGSGTSERTDAYLFMLWDAEQAGRPWARLALDQALRRGCGADLKAWHKAQRPIVFAYRGQAVQKTAVIGVREVDAEGRSYQTQTLFDVLTWDQIEKKIQEYAKQVQAYRTDIALMARLLDLRELAPAASTPAEAAELLGTTVADFLGTENAAA